MSAADEVAAHVTVRDHATTDRAVVVGVEIDRRSKPIILSRFSCIAII